LDSVKRWGQYSAAEDGVVVLADIGSDHCLVPVQAVERELVNSAVAVEVAQRPYQRAATAAQRYDDIEVRLGDGLTALAPGEVDLILIGGMGGREIARILEDGQQVVCGPTEGGAPIIIMQPMSHEAELRRFLFTVGMSFGEERIISENGRYYQLSVVSMCPPGGGPWFGKADIQRRLAGKLPCGSLSSEEQIAERKTVLELGALNILQPSRAAVELAQQRTQQVNQALRAFDLGGGRDVRHRSQLVKLAAAWQRLASLLESSLSGEAQQERGGEQ
jgi:hypothetical protein